MSVTTHPFYEAIQSVFDGDGQTPSISILSGDRIYEDQLPPDTDMPAMRMALITETPSQRLKTGDNVTAEVQFDVYAHRGDRGSGWDMDRAIRRLLDRQSFTADGFSRVETVCVQRGRPFQEQNRYRIMSRYRLYGSVA